MKSVLLLFPPPNYLEYALGTPLTKLVQLFSLWLSGCPCESVCFWVCQHCELRCKVPELELLAGFCLVFWRDSFIQGKICLLRVLEVGEPFLALGWLDPLLVLWLIAPGDCEGGGGPDTGTCGWLLSGWTLDCDTWTAVVLSQLSAISPGFCRATEPSGDCREQAGRWYSLSTWEARGYWTWLAS